MTALRYEANPIIEYLKLHQAKQNGLFQHYENDNLTLTLSGVGQINMAAAVIECFHLYPPKKCGWLNIGIAGSRQHPIGAGFLIGKVVYKEKTWYPQILFDTPLPIAELETLDSISHQYSERLCDMEASAFLDIASRLSIYEFIHSIKIVSDNPHSPQKNITPYQISSLIESHLANIEHCISRLSALQKTLPTLPDQNLFENLTSQYHFSEYQRFRLKRLLTRWQLLIPHEPTTSLLKSTYHNAELLLEALEAKLNQTPIDVANTK